MNVNILKSLQEKVSILKKIPKEYAMMLALVLAGSQVDAQDNVLIADSSSTRVPVQKLDVDGAVRIGNTTNAAFPGSIRFNDTNELFEMSEDGTWKPLSSVQAGTKPNQTPRWNDTTNQREFVDNLLNDGTNIGIGTTNTNPAQYLLQIMSNDASPNTKINLLNLNNAAGSGSYIRFTNRNGNPDNGISSSYIGGIRETGNPNISPQSLVFGTASASDVPPTEKMRLTGIGNLGLGTDNPLGKFHVNGGSIFQTLGQDGYAELRTSPENYQLWYRIDNPFINEPVLRREMGATYVVYGNNPNVSDFLGNSFFGIDGRSLSGRTALTVIHDGDLGNQAVNIQSNDTIPTSVALQVEDGHVEVFDANIRVVDGNIITQNGTVVAGNGDVYVTDPTRGVILTAPNNDCYRIVVNTVGQLGTVLVACP